MNDTIYGPKMKQNEGITFDEESRKRFVKGFTTNKKIAQKKRLEEDKIKRRRDKRSRSNERKKEKLNMVLQNMCNKL